MRKNGKEPTPENPRAAGPPLLHPEDGAMEEKSVRMPARYWRHVREQGGSKYLRDLVKADMQRETGPGRPAE